MFGLYRFQERPCIVAPWLENGNINKYLKHHSEAPRLPLVVGVARGLCYLHSRGIVHGDLKGSNVLVDDQGMARVADFGISSISDPQILTLTSHSGFASNGGTVRWQAPELITMHDDMAVSNNKPSDIYAWACVCYEIFTGRIPLDHLANDAAVVYHVAFKGTRPSRPSNSSPSWTSWGLTTEIWSIMEDCWKAEPTDRPTISSVLRRLRSSAIDSEVDMQFSPRHFRALMNKTLTNSRILSTRVLDEIALHHNALTGSALWRKKLQSSQTNYHNPSTSASLDFSQATSLVNGTHGRYSDERATSSNMRHLITRLCAIFDDNIQYKQLLDGHGTKAQTLLDVFQTLLDLSEITSDFKRNVTVAAQELSKRSGLLPKCYILEDLKIDDVSGAFFTREGLSGYHRGDYLGRTVSLKALRSHQGTTNGQLPKEISTDLIILWSQLSHTNLLPVFGLYQFQSCIYLVSPWMENGHILEFLQTNSHTNRALLLLDVATGIAYLHDNNIVHGELKGVCAILSFMPLDIGH
ncbi:putative serine/threonine-protein kinase [Termitomyces sp. J132]|nr:putative serine/threonine-protein kinase [Termitomyces sp. J132]